MSEVWKAVVGYEGTYEVSDHGRVRSLDRERMVWSAKANRFTHSFFKGQQMKLKVEVEKKSRRPKRIRVTLCNDGVARDFFVHRLVLEAFVGPMPDGCECSHLNGDGLDNRLVNLIYESHVANCARRKDHDTESVGSRNGSAKLTEAEVLRMRSLAGLLSNPELARVFQMSRHHVWRIQSRRIWSHI